MRNFSRDFAKKLYNNGKYKSKKNTSEVFVTCMLLLIWGGIAVKIIIEAGK